MATESLRAPFATYRGRCHGRCHGNRIAYAGNDSRGAPDSQDAGAAKTRHTLRVQVPKETINLLELAVTIAQQHVALLVEKGPRRNFNTRLNAQDAYALLASRYEATGRFTEALDARQKAVEFAQALVKSNPSASNRHVLAQATISFADIYSTTKSYKY